MKSVRTIRDALARISIPEELKQHVSVELATLEKHERQNGGVLPQNNQVRASYHNLRKVFKTHAND